MEEQDGYPVNSCVNATLRDKLAEVEQLLEEYEEKIFLSKVKVIEPPLEVTREELLSMSLEDIDGLRWSLSQYNLALQKELNKHLSRMHWAEANLNRLLDRDANNYQGFGWAERKAACLNADKYAQKLFQLKTQSEMVINRLSFLPGKIEFLVKIAGDIAYTKRRSRNDEHN